MYSGNGITFNSAGFWSFDNYAAINVIIFDVDNSSPSQADSRKKSLLVLGEGINGSFGSPEKRLVLFLVKQTQNVA